MAWVERRVTRTSQPQSLVGIDWDNPISNGFVRLANASDAGNGTLFDSVNPNISYTSTAPALSVNTGGLSLAKNSTIVWLGSSNEGHANIGTGDATFVFGGIDNSNNTAQYFCQLGGQSAVSGNVFVGNRSGGVVAINVFGGALATSVSNKHIAGRYETTVIVRRSGVAHFYINGEYLGSAANSSSFGSGVFSLGSSSGNQRDVNYAGLATRALSDAEAISLSENPWQIFEPEVIRIWVDDYVSAGGGATVIPIGVQATGSVGTPGATGAANATLAGVSANASVGTPTATGGSSIAATALPAGVAASSAVGTPTATGAAVAQPVGVSTVSAVGVPVAIGETVGVTVAYPEGVQAQGYVGTLSATAAAVVIPIGVQAVGEVGDVLAYAGDEPPVVASSNYGFEMSAGKRYYIKRKGKILLFDSAEQADDYLATEQQAIAVKSRGAKKRIASKLVKVAPIETIELEPVTELLSRYMPDVSLPNLLKMRDIEQVLKMQQQALLMQDDEDIELLLMTL